MGIFDKIREKKAQFQERIAVRRQQNFDKREEKLARLNNERLKLQAERQQKQELASERKMIFEEKTAGVRAVFGKLQSAGQNFQRKTGGGGFGSKVRGRLGQNAKASSGGMNIFTAGSNTPNNIYTQGNRGNNPFGFTSSRATTTKKRRGKSITIRL